MASTPSLDHLILFLPCCPTSHTPLIPDSLSKNFTVIPGGTHADGITSNSLIALADGCYIELICFLPQTDPHSKSIEKHWWGPDPKRRGWTDWCLTTGTSAEENFERLEENENRDGDEKDRGKWYEKPVKGGRNRPDGQEVRWSVTFPNVAPAAGEGGGKRRGEIPFFCHDETGREVRVPSAACEERKRDSSGVLGVVALTVLVDGEEEFERVERVYERVFAVKGVKDGRESEVIFEVGRVVDVETLSGSGAKVILKLAKSEQERERVVKRGFWFGDVVLGAVVGDGKTVGMRERIDEGEDDLGGIWVEYVAE